MSDDQKRKENILSESKLRMYATPVQGADKSPVLIPDIFENNPRLRVRTNVQNDANKGYIEAPMNSKVWFKLMAGIRRLANKELKNPDGSLMDGFRIDNYGHPFLQGQRSKDKKIVSITSVVRGPDGIIRLSVTAGKTRPIIDFVFLEDDYHYFKDVNGNVMPESVSSELAALAWANMMEKYMAIALTEYITPAWVLKRQQQQAANGGGNFGGGGGYQGNRQQGGGNYNNGGGGYQQPSQSSAQGGGNIDSFDIDIPM